MSIPERIRRVLAADPAAAASQGSPAAGANPIRLRKRPALLLERFDPEAWARAVQQHRLYVAGRNPAAMRMVLDAGIAPDRLASLGAVRSGTAATPPELQAAFEDRYGIPVLPTYGVTEFAGSVASWSLDDHRLHGQRKRGASGRAHPGIELRTVDRETGTVQPPGAEGILEVRADQIAAGDWVRTTDLAVVDADGFLWIRGRVDDAIVRGEVPVTIKIVDDLPRTPSMKVSRPALRDLLAADLGGERAKTIRSGEKK